MNGRPVFQPTCNPVPGYREIHNSTIKKLSPPQPHPSRPAEAEASFSCLLCSRSPKPQATEEKAVILGRDASCPLHRHRSKSFNGRGSMEDGVGSLESSSLLCPSLMVHSPGSIATVRRELMALQQAQRKMRIAHYGRSKTAKFNGKIVPLDSVTISKISEQEAKRCSFITANSDPLYVAYHDEEWGLPVHDDRLLLELLVLSGAQVGSDWTSILRQRQDFSNAFSGYNVEILATFADKQMLSISLKYGIDIGRVRGVVDNSMKIIEIKRDFGSFDKYLWGFVNYKPICTQYKSCHKIPVKTSKSETISRDMQRRGFRFVGPTVIHSFMQAAGLTNDHLITCHRHIELTRLANHAATIQPIRSSEQKDNKN
ncbi:uncharacterized protein LOC116212818 [Punica granatum]|uniref:Uncharacterized protein LOC116212818 n=1 Tax=Punica granatum TaxID=22663 RepID=A0A218XVI4_PUNGR|nr:uncharacterized protein LOC116212818 [Punica granatum]OWM88521.1 hypothetical protein CDL15_Pgr002288 [Punica granatum]